MCGGNIFFIDFMKHPDRFIFWDTDKINDILLSGDVAAKKIMAWIKDEKNGPVRSQHKLDMERFIEFMEYRFHDFSSYETNLMDQLRKNVFYDNSAFEDI